MSLTSEIPERKKISNRFKWNLEDIYLNDELWEKEYLNVSTECENILKYEDTLNKDAGTLLKCLKQNDIYSVILDRLYVYANMRFHEDSRNTFYQAMSNKAEMLLAKYTSLTSFITPKILELSNHDIENFLDENTELNVYRHFLSNTLRKASHTLTAQEESIIAKTDELSGAANNIFTMINDADITFPNIKTETGEELPLTKGRYATILENSDRKIRKTAFNTLYDTYLDKKNTLAAIYYASVKKDVFYSKIRKYGSSLEYALSDDNIPISVYNNLITAVHNHLPLLHRYIKLRKRLLNINTLHMYDLYAPLIADANISLTFEESKKYVVAALEPLGEEYTHALNIGFNNGWIDIYENKGKRGGAYSWGTYSAHPYVLLNHSENIHGMFILAHEMGHAMHSYYSWKKQPYIYSGHKIFVAEVASTVNESLLMEYLLKNKTDPKIRLYLLNHFMEQFRGTFFRQSMFAEFEMVTHEMVEKGKPLTWESLNTLYHSLNETYFGKDIVVDEKIDIEWARIPHFYNPFYVYQYATGYSAAITLSEKILTEGKGAINNYLRFLEKGTSEYSVDLLKGAGVDMTTLEPINNAMKKFEEILTQMENL